jgi:hypothetical protein
VKHPQIIIVSNRLEGICYKWHGGLTVTISTCYVDEGGERDELIVSRDLDAFTLGGDFGRDDSVKPKLDDVLASIMRREEELGEHGTLPERMR